MENEMSDDDCSEGKCATEKKEKSPANVNHWDKRKEITPVEDDKRSYIPKPRPLFVRQKLRNINLG